MALQGPSWLRPSVRTGVVSSFFALLIFVGSYCADGLDNPLVRGLCIVFSALAVTNLAAMRRSVIEQALTAIWISVAWFLVLVLLSCAITLAQSEGFDEGGPIGLTLVLGFYLGLPIAVLAVVLAPVLSLLAKHNR